MRSGAAGRTVPGVAWAGPVCGAVPARRATRGGSFDACLAAGVRGVSGSVGKAENFVVFVLRALRFFLKG